MKFIQDFEVENKRVLVRCDFNVPLDEKGNILDDFRIKETIPTINYLIKNKAKIILMSHLDDPEGKVVESLRLTPVQEKLKEYLDLSVRKTRDCIGREIEKLTSQMRSGEVLLLENLRFHKEEEENKPIFAKELSKLADIFINDAFGACHRAHASIVGLPKYLPSGGGFLLEKEIKNLSKVLENPERPLVIVIGGVKVETKIKTILNLLEKADHLLLGSKIGVIILAQKGILTGRSFPEEKLIEKIDITNPKIHLPVDGVIGPKELKEESPLRKGGIGSLKKEEEVYDIGPETIKIFKEIINEAKTIFWNGPVGMFEDKRFTEGGNEVLDTILGNHKAFKIAGGGETISAINDKGVGDKFNFISTGGGVMLEFLADNKLPGLEALNYYGK